MGKFTIVFAALPAMPGVGRAATEGVPTGHTNGLMRLPEGYRSLLKWAKRVKEALPFNLHAQANRASCQKRRLENARSGVFCGIDEYRDAGEVKHIGKERLRYLATGDKAPAVLRRRCSCLSSTFTL